MVMNRVLTPIGEEIKAAVIPVKAWLAPAGNAGGLNTADNNFVRARHWTRLRLRTSRFILSSND